MSRGDWGFVCTIWGCLALSCLAVSDSRQRRYQEARATSERQRPSQFERERRGIPAPFEAFTANPDPQNADEREKRDLAAQEASAAWAFWVALFSGIQMIATIIGLYFVKRTLDATLAAVEDTGEATIAMREANRIAKQASEHQVRPWVEVTVENVRLSLINNNPRATASLWLHNFKHSPALDIGFCFFMALGENPKEHIDYTINMFRSSIIDWKDINLFHGSKYEALVSCEHDGEVEEGVPAFVYAIAFYRSPVSRKLRYTARLFDLIDQHTGESNTFKGWPLNARFIAKPSKTFIGYAT